MENEINNIGKDENGLPAFSNADMMRLQKCLLRIGRCDFHIFTPEGKEDFELYSILERIMKSDAIIEWARHHGAPAPLIIEWVRACGGNADIICPKCGYQKEVPAPLCENCRMYENLRRQS